MAAAGKTSIQHDPKDVYRALTLFDQYDDRGLYTDTAIDTPSGADTKSQALVPLNNDISCT